METTQTKRLSGDDWQGIIKEQSQSQQSISEFCRERGIKENRFHYWNKRMKSASSFLPLKPALSKMSVRFCLRLPQGFVIEMNELPPVEWLNRLLNVSRRG